MKLLTPIFEPLTAWGTRAEAAVRRHPHRVAGTVLALLGGFAVTAFGIAPMAPDAADLPRRLVSEDVQVADLSAQIEALATQALELSRTDLTRSTDTTDSLLKRLGVADPAAAAFIRGDRNGRRLIEGRSGKMVQVRAGSDGRLLELVARFPALDSEQMATHFTRLTIARVEDGYQSKLETAPLVPQVRLGSGTVRSSLFAATDEADLPDAIAVQMVDMFATEIDFHHQLRKGDTFSVVYEALTADDQPITWNEATGRVLAAEFTNGGKVRQALWFRNGDGKSGYFALNGQSKKRSFLASPLEFSRVTSGFAMRMHPLAQTWRKHNGIDYSAPQGTPVRVVGDGVVDFAGWQNGYGNVVQVKHGNERSTVYAHLSRIDVRVGQRLEQGQRLGAVGATGWATGPHLHFEFRINGQYQDPVAMAGAAESVAIDPASRPRFEQTAKLAQSQLQVAETLAGAHGRAE